MAQRLLLHETLVDILGAPDVYFQPPPTQKMAYPCIVYKRDDEDVRFAGNKPYTRVKRYQVTVIDRSPDSSIPDRIAELPLCVFDRFFTANDLNHDVYKLFF